MTATDVDPAATAGALLERFGDVSARRGEPVWLEWRGQGDPEVREVASSEGLLGRVVDADWDGAAVVGTGRLRLLDEGHEPPAALQTGFAGGLRLSCALSRRGRLGWRMRLPDGTFYDRVPEEGFMLDILLRSLSLPTPPPPVSVGPLDLAAWVAAISDQAWQTGRRLGWDEAVDLQPQTAISPAGWEDVRRTVAAGLQVATAPPPPLAAWMDAGMFARWVLGRLPPLPALLDLARPHLLPAAYRKVAHLARVLDERICAR